MATMTTSQAATDRVDRLYDLLPAIHRIRDADQGYPLRALLQVIAEQVNVIEDDIAQLYDNWFIETCEDWVVPYIGSLIGYQPVANTGEPSGRLTPRAEARERVVIPRQEVANTIRFRRRKGTLRVLEALAWAVAGWPVHAVEFYRRLAVAQNLNYQHLNRGRLVDIRDGQALDRLEGPFDRIAHTVDVRRVSSAHFPGKYNIPEVGLFVWRLKTYSVTQTPAYLYEGEGQHRYLFSALGQDTQLYRAPSIPARRSGPPLPIPIYRRDLVAPQLRHEIQPGPSPLPKFFGEGKNIQILTGTPREPVDPANVVVADLSDWYYRPAPGQVAIDPQLGRIVFPVGTRRQGVWVSYRYAFSADIGGGEYDRPITQAAGSILYAVGEGERFTRINDALGQWTLEQPRHAVIEITDSGVYVEQIGITLHAGQTLQIRAALHKRPIIRLLDWQNSAPDDLTVTGEKDCWIVFDGLTITGRGVMVDGSLAGVTIRHCTLVPGWGLECDCEPTRPTDASLELDGTPDCLVIEHSIVGAIRVERDERKQNPMVLKVSDSIIDATDRDAIALGAEGKLCADTMLTIVRSTVFGLLQTREIALAENSILMGLVRVCRRQAGCIRFCYVTPGSRTPRRYECQPDLVERPIDAEYLKGKITAAERDIVKARERLRVEPQFNSVRYGKATYCQLADQCAVEITRGAEDRSEMGVFHDLYQPQRLDNLAVRLSEFTPAGVDAGVIIVN
jgi:hypothetical protein